MAKTIQFWSNPQPIKQMILANQEALAQIKAFAANKKEVASVISQNLNLQVFNNGAFVKAVATLVYEPN